MTGSSVTAPGSAVFRSGVSGVTGVSGVGRDNAEINVDKAIADAS